MEHSGALSDAKPPAAAAVLLATTPATGLACPEGTLADRLARQLASLHVPRVHVVTRATDLPALPARPAVLVAGPAVEPVTEPPAGPLVEPDVTRSAGLTGDLRAVAEVARAVSGPLAVLPGDLVAHTDALALLLADPARGTGALVSPEHDRLPPVRAERGRVVAAGNSFHTVSGANGGFRGVLHVGEADLVSLADVAEELASLAQDQRLGGAEETEVADLLLAGLVRVGVPVRAAPLGRLHCDRVTGQPGADAAIARLGEVDEGRARLEAAVKSDDGFVATYFVSSWSGHVVRLAARLGLTPNAVTGLSVGLAGLAAVAFSAGERRAQVAGAALLFLSFVLDCVDGQLARYTRMFSPLGAWLDATFDRVKEYVVYVGLAVGYAGGVELGPTGPGGIWALAVAAMLVQAIRHMIDFSYAGARADAAGAGQVWERPEHGGSLGLPVALRRDSSGGPGTSGGPGKPGGAGTPGGPGKPGGAGTPGVVVAPGRRRGDGSVARLSARLDRNTASRWLKKIVVLPIGERMVLIALTAAIFNARVTFVALLAWGGLAALYTLTGRIARSL
ncbi:CDP-alcohol phosphatidyltransferase family protein [Sphaerisporangium sp. NPDC049002]|uniref:CDP-alcohol phosphatidyltransferase family protein n=1 Tax=Sphaerisporangium sp. NPDC049002 TaxID=3155392 RepID=UPI0033C23F2C